MNSWLVGWLGGKVIDPISLDGSDLEVKADVLTSGDEFPTWSVEAKERRTEFIIRSHV